MLPGGPPRARAHRLVYDLPVKHKILFLCTGNSARSQMAEALARLDHGNLLDPVSAGSYPTGWVHQLAIQAMNALGASMDGARSKPAKEFQDTPFDVVVTVCERAAQDCPSWPNAKRVEHWPIEDPSFGDSETRYARFVSTRDELRRRIRVLAEDLRGGARTKAG